MTGALIVFDIDGTLMDHRAAADEALDNFLRLVGTEPTPSLHNLWIRAEREHFTAWRKGKVSFTEQRRLRMADLLKTLGKTIGGEAKLDQLFELYLAEYERAWRAYPDAPPCLVELRSRGFELAALSNGNSRQQDLKLEHIGVREFFSYVLTSDSLGAAKPHREAFDRAAEALSSPSAELTYIGDDVEVDVLAARAAGWHAFHLDRFGTSHVQGRIKSLSELPALLDR
ncbi:putative hydrolase of the HAD superfamily [Actinomyces ruminicola]|uniref:Putative hydrolase of the HAD superfamily n=1 Tax=Actinomyces ruminicola TaxID=332524 RepID=A0A1H0EVR5_9ACTO|nr:HAD family hydrolase [Actinomyces ruminicola]SDN86445.1 putative hydrolase of the HAD superfamily [Actinomyces ruminicola]